MAIATTKHKKWISKQLTQHLQNWKQMQRWHTTIKQKTCPVLAHPQASTFPRLHLLELDGLHCKLKSLFCYKHTLTNSSHNFASQLFLQCLVSYKQQDISSHTFEAQGQDNDEIINPNLECHRESVCAPLLQSVCWLYSHHTPGQGIQTNRTARK